MLEKIKKDKFIIFIEYAFVFGVISLAYFFMVPQSDVFLFARATQGGLSNVLEYALYYGNGRLLGNILGMLFSNYFEFAFLVVSIGCTLIVYLINKLIFNNNSHMVILLAILVAFPSSNLISETYYLFASFCNYVVPCIFLLISLNLLKNLANYRNNIYVVIVKCILLGLTGTMSCLFSENTTAVVLTISVLQLAYSIIIKRKVLLAQLVYLISTFVGVCIMLLIPTVTSTSQKMDHYRGVEISLSRIIANFVKLSEVLCNFTFVIIVLSVALIYLCLKKTNINSKIKAAQISYFVCFSLLSIVLSDFETRDIYISRVNMVSMLSVIIYFVLAVWVIFSIAEKKLCIQLIFFGIVLASSIVPMMIVTQYGYRTYYITMLIIVVFSLYVIKLSQVKKAFAKIPLEWRSIKTYFGICSGTVFLFLGIFCFVQSVYNYDFYIIRTDMVQEQLDENKETGIDDYVEVFTLPCEGISIEDEYVNLVFDVIDGGQPAKMKTVGILDCKSADEILAILDSSFYVNLKFAFENLEYKNPLVLSN